MIFQLSLRSLFIPSWAICITNTNLGNRLLVRWGQRMSLATISVPNFNQSGKEQFLMQHQRHVYSKWREEYSISTPLVWYLSLFERQKIWTCFHALLWTIESAGDQRSGIQSRPHQLSQHDQQYRNSPHVPREVGRDDLILQTNTEDLQLRIRSRRINLANIINNLSNARWEGVRRRCE